MRQFHFTLFFIVLLLFVIGLSASWTQHDPLAKNKEVVRRVFEELWNKGNLSMADELFATDFVAHHQRNPDEDRKGIEAEKQYITSVRSAFPDLKFTIEDQVAEGDKVATRWVVNATNTGAYQGQPATNKHVMVTGIGISRIANGKIAEAWSNYDELGLMQQLGVIPTPEPALETVTLAVTGMTWAGCTKAVQSALENIEGVESVEINLATNKAMVFFEKGKATAKQLVSAVDKAKGMAKYSATVAGAQ